MYAPTIILLVVLFIGIALDWYTTKVGLGLGLEESYPLFKGKSHSTILAIKLVGFGFIAYAFSPWSAPPEQTWWLFIVWPLAILQFVAAWNNWQKIKPLR